MGTQCKVYVWGNGILLIQHDAWKDPWINSKMCKIEYFKPTFLEELKHRRLIVGVYVRRDHWSFYHWNHQLAKLTGVVDNGEVSLNLARLGGLGLDEVGRLAEMVGIQLLSEGLVSGLGEHRLFLKDGEKTQGL